MSLLYTFILVVLAVLAVLGIVVGVSNDAVNFLNSAIGSKVASFRNILIVASAGILVGVITSSGMMEVARSGVFHPEMFSFHEIMFLFLGMMLGNGFGYLQNQRLRYAYNGEYGAIHQLG